MRLVRPVCACALMLGVAACASPKKAYIPVDSQLKQWTPQEDVAQGRAATPAAPAVRPGAKPH